MKPATTSCFASVITTNSVSGFPAIPAALAIVRLARGDPPLAATLGANFGRDTDTVACMAAGICGISPESAELIECSSDETRRAQVDLASRLAALARTKMESELKAIARCPAGVS